jgi:hypothetical protein
MIYGVPFPMIPISVSFPAFVQPTDQHAFPISVHFRLSREKAIRVVQMSNFQTINDLIQTNIPGCHRCCATFDDCIVSTAIPFQTFNFAEDLTAGQAAQCLGATGFEGIADTDLINVFPNDLLTAEDQKVLTFERGIYRSDRMDRIPGTYLAINSTNSRYLAEEIVTPTGPVTVAKLELRLTITVNSKEKAFAVDENLTVNSIKSRLEVKVGGFCSIRLECDDQFIDFESEKDSRILTFWGRTFKMSVIRLSGADAPEWMPQPGDDIPMMEW